MAERAQLCQAYPKTCISPLLSLVKDDNLSLSGPGFLLLKPCPCHNVGGMELNTARNSILYSINHGIVVRALLF